jgi:hypothetical protein
MAASLSLPRGPGLGRPGADGALDLAGRGEASRSLLREDEIAVDDDVEDASRALDELGPDAESCFQLVRQTGGARQVASSAAVLDGDVFGHIDVPLRPIVCPDSKA